MSGIILMQDIGNKGNYAEVRGECILKSKTMLKQ